MSFKLSIGNLMAIMFGIALGFAIVLVPFSPSISFSNFQLKPTSGDNQELKEVEFKVYNEGLLPIWLVKRSKRDLGKTASSGNMVDYKSYARYFTLPNCESDYRDGVVQGVVEVESDNLKIVPGEGLVILFTPWTPNYESVSLHLTFSDWRGYSRLVDCGKLNFASLSDSTINKQNGTTN